MKLAATFCVVTAALTAQTYADKIAAQTTFVDLYKINTSLFDNKESSVLSVFTNQWGQPQARVKLNGFRSTVGQDFATAKDWSQYNVLHLVIQNKETRTVNLKLIVQVKPDLKDLTDAFMTTFQVRPGESLKVCAYLREDDPWPLRMEHLYPVVSSPYRALYSPSTRRSLTKIYAWRINNEDTSSATLEISGPRLLRQSLNPTGIVDKWGQYTDRSWANKIKSDTQLGTLKATELTDLAANPGPGEQFGTSKIVNPSPVPGKWAVIKGTNGRKYLQHPNGKLFWVFGIDTILDVQHTPVEGREHYFTSLQSKTGRFKNLWSDQSTPDGQLMSYSHRTQNLMLKYGDAYFPSWLDMTKKRMASWGINTVGVNSVPELLNNQHPYTLITRTTDFSTKLSVPKSIWGTMPDPYASGYQTFVYNKIVPLIQTPKTHSNFMGLYVDNEMGWGDDSSNASRYNVALGALTAPATQPAKVALMSQLQSKYSSITALNNAWTTTWSSWDSLKNNRTWKPTNYTSSVKSDLGTYVTNFAKKYFGAVRGALNSAGFKSLYLGCRFAHYTPEVVSAASSYVDVLSFNAYRFNEKMEWSYFNSLSKPVMFSELGYSVMGWGTMGGIGTTMSQWERGQKMRQVANAAIQQPNVVGAIWYCYQDQPVTGRYSDYENAGLGVVDIADTPYSDVVSFFRSFTKSMYTTRGGGGSGDGGDGGGGDGGTGAALNSQM